MRIDPKMERHRILTGMYGTAQGEPYGAFYMPSPKGGMLRIIASPGNAELGVDWQHVSVSHERRCPNWYEMCLVKSMFWDDEETVMQIHPPKSQWINNHPNCLHMWKPNAVEIPLPPGIAVGFKDAGILSK